MIVNRLLSKILNGRKVRLRHKWFSTTKSKSPDDNIRNIAILAHIDAGDVLYYSICLEILNAVQ